MSRSHEDMMWRRNFPSHIQAGASVEPSPSVLPLHCPTPKPGGPLAHPAPGLLQRCSPLGLPSKGTSGGTYRKLVTMMEIVPFSLVNKASCSQNLLSDRKAAVVSRTGLKREHRVDQDGGFLHYALTLENQRTLLLTTDKDSRLPDDWSILKHLIQGPVIPK